MNRDFKWPASLERLCVIFGWSLMAMHCIIAVAYNVDVPILDEWQNYRPEALDRHLNLPWLFELHNEHRLVMTKLLAWGLYRAGNLSSTAQVAINFAVYAATCAMLLRFLRRRFDAPVGFLLIPLACPLIHDVHAWSFQSHFHLYVFFFVLALWAVSCGGWRSWLAPVFAGCSVYSFASGVICSLAVVCVSCVFAYLRPHARWAHLAQAALVSAITGSWFLGFHKNPVHPPYEFPWSGKFWTHFCTGLGRGFGWDTGRALGGGIGLLLLSVILAAVIMTRRRSRADTEAWTLGLAYVGALVAAMAATSMARAGFPTSATASRYLEAVLLMVPAMWILMHEAARPWQPLLLIFAGLICGPYLNEMNLVKPYEAARKERVATLACISKYLNGIGNADCPGSFPVNIASRLDHARSLKMPFIETLSQLAPLEDPSKPPDETR